MNLGAMKKDIMTLRLIEQMASTEMNGRTGLCSQF